MSVTEAQVMQQLRTVNDPELHRDLVTLGMIKKVAICEGLVRVDVELTTPACPLKDQIEKDVKQAVHAIGAEVKQVEVQFSAQVRKTPQQAASANNPLPNVKHIIAVGAGKGGVGKSTIAVNVAVGLAKLGAKVGLMDGDIYGPSIPTMMGLDGLELRAAGDGKIAPFFVSGIKTVTIGSMVEPEKPLIWRGPMAHGAFRDLVTRTAWGELDYLIIDLPPGTGDVPLTMSQLLPLTGAVVVCTPQKVAQDDARRAVRMFQQLSIDVLGVVENMSYFIGDDGKEYDLFGRGGAEMMAQQMGVPYLGGVPINTALRKNCDAGTPLANFDDAKLGGELMLVVKNLAGQISVKAMAGSTGPTISIDEDEEATV
jgi:ATP-binding protein involved in chromosome partitioning